uniref:Pepsin inhibitor-3-like repeated domain-containing protein n=1 Tax=Meloidogyne incognita TaxID=6306 RepID=A0A914LQG2_MELIC
MIIGIRTSTTFFAFILPFIAISLSFAEKQNRAKRFAAFGSLATIGGKVGCVVSQNKLFINGHFVKDLDVDEQSELKDYQASLDEFKTKQRQKQVSGVSQQTKKPEPPKKPSFCSDKATTQYIFDGCSVQGDNIYIGDTFVRKLTADEQRELEQFDAKFSTYQKAATADFRKKVQSAFGEHFGSLFGGFIGGGGSDDEKENDNSGGSSLANLEAPKAPNLCTLII